MTVEPPPASARLLFGDELPRVLDYVRLLTTEAIERGLLGPREGSRLWDRHILNSAVVSDAVPPRTATVVDVGSGAGLPGVPLALRRPELQVVLLEPLARRAAWLHATVERLGLSGRVAVVRGRAEDAALEADVAVSRAVAPLRRLLPWCAGLVRPGGRVVALKGRSAPDELEGARGMARDLGLVDPCVTRCGHGVLAEATYLIVAERGPGPRRVPERVDAGGRPGGGGRRRSGRR